MVDVLDNSWLGPSFGERVCLLETSSIGGLGRKNNAPHPVAELPVRAPAWFSIAIVLGDSSLYLLSERGPMAHPVPIPYLEFLLVHSSKLPKNTPDKLTL